MGNRQNQQELLILFSSAFFLEVIKRAEVMQELNCMIALKQVCHECESELCVTHCLSVSHGNLKPYQQEMTSNSCMVDHVVTRTTQLSCFRTVNIQVQEQGYPKYP